MERPEKDTGVEEKPKKKDPCRRKKIDFHLCEKTYGFNDNYCKCTESFRQTTFPNTKAAFKAICSFTLASDIHHPSSIS